MTTAAKAQVVADRWRTLTPKQQARALKQYRALLMRELANVDKGDGDIARRAVAVETGYREWERHELALESKRGTHIAFIRRPLIRIRDRGRARRGRRAALRRSPARSPGQREPEPPARPAELEVGKVPTDRKRRALAAIFGSNPKYVQLEAAAA